VKRQPNPGGYALRKLLESTNSYWVHVHGFVNDDNQIQWKVETQKHFYFKQNQVHWIYRWIRIVMPIDLSWDSRLSLEERIFNNLAHEIGHCVAAPTERRVKNNFGHPTLAEEERADVIEDYLRFKLGPVKKMIWRRTTRPHRRWFEREGKKDADLFLKRGLAFLLPEGFRSSEDIHP